jgi:hypothetical protein
MPSPLNTIRAKLRSKTITGGVPLRARVVAGNGQDCSGCDRPMDGGPVWEVEFPGGQIIRLHAECETYWRIETGN